MDRYDKRLADSCGVNEVEAHRLIDEAKRKFSDGVETNRQRLERKLGEDDFPFQSSFKRYFS